jgi:hypothetical protein
MASSTSGMWDEIIDGKRSIDPIQAKALGEYFQISASLFI